MFSLHCVGDKIYTVSFFFKSEFIGTNPDSTQLEKDYYLAERDF